MRKQKVMLISVGTGQEGKDIAHGICFSIQHHNPDFIVFLNTKKSRETTMPYIVEDCKMNERKWDQIDIDDADDVEKITSKCQEAIRSLTKEGYVLNQIVVDYTSGTKAMSAGLTVAAIREKVGILTYTTGKRGDGGRVISGTERAFSLGPNQIFADDLFREAIYSFNSYHFLYQEKENLFCPERTLDLMENAKRRGNEEHKYDGAVARLYRVCEYLGQFQICSKGLYKTKDGKPDTSDLDVSKLPEALHEKYSRYLDSYDGKVKIHLSGNYDLLWDLDHPMGTFFREQEKRFKKLMGLRDLSILAHGFNPVSAEAYKDMLQLIQDSIITAIRELAKELPESERYLLRDQVSRAADSVCLKVRKEGTRL